MKNQEKIQENNVSFNFTEESSIGNLLILPENVNQRKSSNVENQENSSLLENNKKSEKDKIDENKENFPKSEMMDLDEKENVKLKIADEENNFVLNKNSQGNLIDLQKEKLLDGEGNIQENFNLNRNQNIQQNGIIFPLQNLKENEDTNLGNLNDLIVS